MREGFLDKSLNEYTLTELQILKDACQKWIDSDKNDGRLTEGSSAELDYMFDTIDEVNTELFKRQGLKAN